MVLVTGKQAGREDDDTEMQYTDTFKARMVRRMLGPNSVSADALEKEVGVSQPTLSRWLRETATFQAMAKKDKKAVPTSAVVQGKRPQDWTPAEKLRAIADTLDLEGEALGEYLRRHGIHLDLKLLNSQEFVDLSPHQVVAKLADMNVYKASERTMYRVLKRHKLQVHRGRTRPRTCHRPSEHRATGPRQVWSWDITYLRSPIRGRFWLLYMVVDVWSRKIVAARVHDHESDELASVLIERHAGGKASTAQGSSSIATTGLR